MSFDGVVKMPVSANMQQAAQNDLEASKKNLETAKLVHKKMTEQLSMRTATVAQMACAVLTSKVFGPAPGMTVKVAVGMAEEVMVEAEERAAKAKELQRELEGKV